MKDARQFTVRDGAQISIRTGTGEDVPALQEHINTLDDQARMFRLSSAQRTDADFVRAMVGEGKVFLAFDSSGALIGEALCKRSSPEGTASVAVSVAAGWRERGVGKALLGELIEHAKRAGYCRLITVAHPRNTSAQSWLRDSDAREEVLPILGWSLFELDI